MHRHVPLYTFAAAAAVERQFYAPSNNIPGKKKCAATQRRHTNRRAAAKRPREEKEDIRNVVMSLRAPVRPPPPHSTRTESCMAPACHDGKRYGIARHDSTHHE
jgi:hypothetical protein